MKNRYTLQGKVISLHVDDNWRVGTLTVEMEKKHDFGSTRCKAVFTGDTEFLKAFQIGEEVTVTVDGQL